MKALTLMCVIAVAVPGCAKRAPEVDLSRETPRVVLFASPQNPVEVRAAVVSALQTRGWTTDGEADGRITARLAHKGSSARLELAWGADSVTLKGLEADLPQPQYARWLANLESSIREALKAPPEPAPAKTKATPRPTLAVFQATQTLPGAKQALQRALAQHSWTPEEEVSGQTALVARLSHRKGQVRVRVDYSESQASISYLSSTELEFDAAGRSDDYEKWMRNLVAAIVANTGAPR